MLGSLTNSIAPRSGHGTGLAVFRHGWAGEAMDPSHVMAAFLRDWRQQWAGLSRAQLAHKVRQVGGGRAVTSDVVRRWEQGQPPKNDRQLDALLCALSSGNAGHLTAAERLELETLCVQAAGARRFPARSWWREADIANRADVAELAVAALHHEWRAPEASSTIALWAATQHLGRAVGGDLGDFPHGHRVQQVYALAAFRTALAHKHQAVGRFRMAASISHATAELLEEWFGPWGRVEGLLVMNSRTEAALSEELSRPPAQRRGSLLALAETAWALGDPAASAYACFNGLGPKLTVREFDRRAPLLLEVWQVSQPGPPTNAHLALFWAYAWQGRWDEAERHLLACQRWANAGGMDQVQWHGACAHLLSSRGDLAEAETHLHKGLALGDQCGFLAHVREFRKSLEHLEHAKASQPGK